MGDVIETDEEGAILDPKPHIYFSLQVILEPGDMLEVPRGKTHFASVVGNEPCEFVDASKR